jgi:hypothetical protein
MIAAPAIATPTSNEPQKSRCRVLLITVSFLLIPEIARESRAHRDRVEFHRDRAGLRLGVRSPSGQCQADGTDPDSGHDEGRAAEQAFRASLVCIGIATGDRAAGD